MKANERAFEDAIEAWLLEHGGYGSGDRRRPSIPRSASTRRSCSRSSRTTQEKALAQLVSRYGGEAGDAESGFLKRLAAEIDDRGTLDVLRHGVVDQGVSFRLAYFKPAHGLTPELRRAVRGEPADGRASACLRAGRRRRSTCACS